MLSKRAFFFLNLAASRKQRGTWRRWERRSGRGPAGLFGPIGWPSAGCRAAVEELEERQMLTPPRFF
jgi:hypothetical protein